MFQTVMVATGDSPWSRNSVAYAIRLATALNPELIMTHIVDEPSLFYPPESQTPDPELRDHMEAAGRDILDQAVQLAKRAGVTSHTVMQRGDIAEQIVKAATAAECDLIVMGTRHLSGDKRLMTGRICNAVIATALCPVLVVLLVQLGRPGHLG